MTKSELLTQIASLVSEVGELRGRVRGYQQQLLTKHQREARSKYEDCKVCGQLWLDGAVPTHRFGCEGWRKFLDAAVARSGLPVALKSSARRG